MRIGQGSGLLAYDPENPRLGKVSGQRFMASFVVELRDPETSAKPETLSYGGVMELEEARERALVALQDPTIPMQRLPYPSLRVELSYKSDPPCFTSAYPDEQGYVVIEVWDSQVNIGYGGAGAELKERAIKALMAELQKVR